MAFILKKVGSNELQSFSLLDILKILGDPVNDEIRIQGEAYRLSSIVESNEGGETGQQLPLVDWKRVPITVTTPGQVNFIVQIPAADPEGLFMVVNGALYDYGTDAAFHLDGNNLVWHGGFSLDPKDRIYIKYLTLSTNS
jgi:hypothetical protein